MSLPQLTHSHQRPRSVIWLILGWHVLSLLIYIILISSTTATTSDVDEVMTPPVKDIGLQAVDDSELSNFPSNQSMEQNNTKPASCDIDVHQLCSKNSECSTLRAECIWCEFNHSCVYGSKDKAMCSPLPNVTCTGSQKFEREYECRYCYQLPHWLTWCNQTSDCALNKPRSFYPAKPFFMSTCWAQSEHLCLGRRCFHKQVPCNWSEGYKWSTTLLLSIFLGGFGVDRFYLGLWKAGIGKLLSFGGLGVWTLVDVILIAVGYVGPWDGSLYI